MTDVGSRPDAGAQAWPVVQAAQGVRMPSLIYGTAWKEHRTAGLVRTAIEAGFRGIDTANQRRHYFEAAVGQAVQEVLAQGRLRRADLFLQTKFTYVTGQDHRLPYDPGAPIESQVEQSFESSRVHLGVEYLDSYLLHGPSTYPGLGEQDWRAWRAMEALQAKGLSRLIGVSNVTVHQLEQLHEQAVVKPAVVQNRSFTRPQADLAVRSFCQKHGILYQGFSLLTAIRPILASPPVRSLAARASCTPEQLLLRYCLDRGMTVLTGTTSPEHMAQDLALHGLKLPSEAAATLDAMLVRS